MKASVIAVYTFCFFSTGCYAGAGNNQRSQIETAISLKETARYTESIALLEKAIKDDPNSFEASHAMYLKASVEVDSGNSPAAKQTISKMVAVWPDSAWTLHAKKLSAKIDGDASGEAMMQGLIKQQWKAAKGFDTGVAMYRNGNTNGALSALRQVVEASPDTPAALQARQSIGNILAKEGDTTGSVHIFQEIVNELEAEAPNSHIVQLAKRRIAALHYRSGRRQSAMKVYTDLLENDENPEIAATAGLEAAGLLFEQVLADVRTDKSVESWRYDEVREACKAAYQMDSATSYSQARAQLIIIETYEWQANYPKMIELSTKFIEEFSHLSEKYPKELASARIICARAFYKIQKPGQAIPLLNQVLQDYRGKNEIWPEMDHLEKAYLFKWRSLRDYGASRQNLSEVASEFKERFPESVYNKFIETETKRLSDQ